MTLDAACRVPNPYGISHDDKMDHYIRHIGRDDLKKHLPADIRTLAAAYLKDQNLNSIPLRKWEAATGYEGYRDEQVVRIPAAKGPFPVLLASHGIDSYSMSEAISILKRVAELEVLDYLAAMLENSDPDAASKGEIWAVFENHRQNPDKLNRYNIFDFDCVRTFPDQAAADKYECGDPGRRVKKRIAFTHAGDNKDGKEARNDG